jgi:cytochrome c-type biogenesis protein CcmF
MFGTVAVWITFALAVISSVFYFLSEKKGNKYLKTGRIAYYGLTSGMIIISLYLLSNILSHNFQLTYVWKYSGTELPGNLLVACFYAGQEGSFLLWGLMLSLIGYVLMPYVSKKGYEPYVMGFYSLILIFVLFILIIKSPFEYVWQTFPGDVAEGFIPQRGRGLNPILQNYWITIHPPILFLGYSAMSVPFAFAMSALLKKDFKNWINVSIPWTLFASGVLGFGIMLGGFWAYETLGWGGFWAWDPVENSSLIPWLVSVALIHTMLVQRRTGGLVKTNIILASLTFIFVLYATFLTRSGILGDSSVHSFADPGNFVYTLLIIMMAFFLLLSLVLLVLRIKDLPKNIENQSRYSSREFGLAIGAIILLVITFIVLFGTSWPILEPLFGQEKISIDAHWYNKWTMPFAWLMLITNAIYLHARWKKTERNVLLKKSIWSVLTAIVFALVAITFGINNIVHLLLIFSILFSISVNFEFTVKLFRKSFAKTGTYLAHTGIALLILGAISSGSYESKEIIRLSKGDTTTVFGFNISHQGKEQIELNYKDREKFAFDMLIEKDGKESHIFPVIYWSDFNDKSSPFKEPGIDRYLVEDIYISPYGLEPEYELEPIDLGKETSEPMPFDSTYKLQLLKFDMAGRNTPEDTLLEFATFVRISTDSMVYEDTLVTQMEMKSGVNFAEWKRVKGTEYEIAMLKIIPDKENLSNSKARYAFREVGKKMPKPKEYLVMEVSRKPFIWLVWLGTILVAFGTFLSIFRTNRKLIIE